LNSLNPSGTAPHELKLKKGALIMLLRNLNTNRGLCNGTRLIVTDLKPNLIITKVLTGSNAGNIVFIPRIDLTSDSDLPFLMRRKQFPLKLAFAMTINKSQGQTLDKVGIHLPNSVFGHGQLYVALFRVRRRCDVKVHVVESVEQGKLLSESNEVFIKNVVYKDILSR
jgi:ATP-dependent DNA helicase PIF1